VMSFLTANPDPQALCWVDLWASIRNIPLKISFQKSLMRRVMKMWFISEEFASLDFYVGCQFLSLILFFFFDGSRIWTQGFRFAKQVLYHWNPTSIPLSLILTPASRAPSSLLTSFLLLPPLCLCIQTTFPNQPGRVCAGLIIFFS
jgi:hypothetical protein